MPVAWSAKVAAAADTDSVWSGVLSAAIDIGVELDGVPPYLALAAADGFEPAAR